MANSQFGTGEFYHIYNRGVEKRDVFSSLPDFNRFLKSVVAFNTIEPIGSIYENAFSKNISRKKANSQLVNIICYCLNPSHYHFIMQQKSDGGISEFMKRLGGGYTKYFNIKYKRSGVLFQGVFKSKHIDSNEYILRASAYVNLNNRVHRLGRETSKSSWQEYIGNLKQHICNTDIVLKQFNNRKEYRRFAEEALQDILEQKQLAKELAEVLLE
jgi:REP element-mobilizing transposase RayT